MKVEIVTIFPCYTMNYVANMCFIFCKPDAYQ